MIALAAGTTSVRSWWLASAAVTALLLVRARIKTIPTMNSTPSAMNAITSRLAAADRTSSHAAIPAPAAGAAYPSSACSSYSGCA